MDLTPPPEPGNVIALNADAAKQLEITKKIQERKYACIGEHTKVEVDPVTRTVQCTTCGFIIDAFDYLEQWAAEGQRRMEGLTTIEIKRKIAQAEHDDLMRKIKNLRQQLKRAGQPQPELERRQYDSARMNTHLYAAPSNKI